MHVITFEFNLLTFTGSLALDICALRGLTISKMPP